MYRLLALCLLLPPSPAIDSVPLTPCLSVSFCDRNYCEKFFNVLSLCGTIRRTGERLQLRQMFTQITPMQCCWTSRPITARMTTLSQDIQQDVRDVDRFNGSTYFAATFSRRLSCSRVFPLSFSSDQWRNCTSIEVDQIDDAIWWWNSGLKLRNVDKTGFKFG